MNNKKSRNGLWWFLLCLPLAFIVYLAVLYSSENISVSEIKSVTLKIPGGAEYKYEDSGNIAFFVDLILNSNDISKPWRDLSDDAAATVTYERVSGAEFKRFIYPDLNTSGCFVKDINSKYASVTESDAKKLLMRAEFQYMYASSLLPKLSVVKSDDQSVCASAAPAQYEWHYKKADGSFSEDKETQLIASNVTPISVIAGADYKFSFAKEPSVSSVTFYNQDIALEATELSALIFPGDTVITAVVSAKWTQTEDCNYYGEGKWSFPVLYDITPTVSLSKTEFVPGELGIVYFEYLNENEAIALETTLKTSPLNVFRNGDKMIAYLPVDLSNKPGEYQISFITAEKTYPFTIKVTEKDYGFSPLTVSAEIYNKTKTPDGIAEKEAFAAAISLAYEKEKIYDADGVFTVPVSGATEAITFGTALLINGIPPNVPSTGTDYTVAEGSAVKAAQRGKVVYAGETTETGKAIVLDHGHGIQTHYYHLQSSARDIGATVQKGEIMAFSGATGMTNGAKLHFAVSVNGIFVNPQMFFTIGVPVM